MLAFNNKKSLICILTILIVITFEIIIFIKNDYIEHTLKYVYRLPSIREQTNYINTKAESEITSLQKKYDNKEIVGILKIENTNINVPIVKHNDNNFYLDHNIYGEYQREGSVFEDYRTSLEDKKILIFGHSSLKWDVPFNELEKYYDKNFYDNHKKIEIVTTSETNIYEIFSVHVETSDFTYMNLLIDSETYNSYLKKYQAKSLYETTAKVHDNDEILILQTCSNKSEYQKYQKKFLLVIAKKSGRDDNEKN